MGRIAVIINSAPSSTSSNLLQLVTFTLLSIMPHIILLCTCSTSSCPKSKTCLFSNMFEQNWKFSIFGNMWPLKEDVPLVLNVQNGSFDGRYIISSLFPWLVVYGNIRKPKIFNDALFLFSSINLFLLYPLI